MNPEHGPEQLEKLLHSLAQEAKPDKSFEQMLQHKLKMRFAAKYSEAKSKSNSSFWSRLLRFKLQVGTALVLMIFTSTTIYAYNSDGVTNGNILYPLKRSVEKVEEIFADSPEEKIDYYNRMAERRIRELDYLEERGEFDEETIIEADKLLSLAEIEVVNIPYENDKNEAQSETTGKFIVEPKPEIIPEISGTADSKKEIALKKVIETHNKLIEKFETHIEKNPKIESKLENLEEKLKIFEEKTKEAGKIKERKKERKKIKETMTTTITDDQIIKPTDPAKETNPTASTDKREKIKNNRDKINNSKGENKNKENDNEKTITVPDASL